MAAACNEKRVYIMVQDVLASRMEMIWTMADIALVQGHVRFNATSSSVKTVELVGLTFTFEDDHLTRIKGPHLDVRILVPVMTMNFDENVVAFPANKSGVHFEYGNDADLTKWHGQCLGLSSAFTVRKKAA